VKAVLNSAAAGSVALVSPALFTANSSGTGQGAFVYESGAINSDDNPPLRGHYLTLFATGEGITNPASADGDPSRQPYPAPSEEVSVKLGEASTEIQFAGSAPGLFLGGVESQSGVTAVIE
jgi:uncharacterized protein (TIGR03437 family)